MEITQLANYGALGLMVLILISLVYYLLKDHKEERKTWHETSSKEQEKSSVIIDKNTEALNNLSSIITVLKTLIENKK